MPVAFLFPVQEEGIGRATMGISRKAAEASVFTPRTVLAVAVRPLMSPLHQE